ncbi:TerB family tellurite resistance protein [Shewanella sp. KX20019]|uniref:TerB family tellurite resistance protein n=1 Tax=Shewanella sp. KX20019 TaxID=2803864 RepID=UPI00192810A4|nr:TerB family tellurite resistance protein [Shewanella sp. KX20019]QQX81374.1 TerB family tellurite resistance protein [Shewanella sp. KX20019]
MYLSELNIGEKKNFLEITKYAMGLNGEYKEEELEVFTSFIYECGLSSYDLQKQDNIDNVIKVLAKSATKMKRIILIELFGILLADGNICDKEEAFMTKLANAFDVESYEYKRYQRWVEAMNDIVSEGYNLINKG